VGKKTERYLKPIPEVHNYGTGKGPQVDEAISGTA
jgi:hypothetical protein